MLNVHFTTYRGNADVTFENDVRVRVNEDTLIEAIELTAIDVDSGKDVVVFGGVFLDYYEKDEYLQSGVAHVDVVGDVISIKKDLLNWLEDLGDYQIVIVDGQTGSDIDIAYGKEFFGSIGVGVEIKNWEKAKQ